MKYQSDTQNPLFLYQPEVPENKGPLMFILATDSNGEVELYWYIHPEEIVEVAVSYPNTTVGVDNTGNHWSGSHILHFIKSANSSKRFYHHLKKQV